MYLNTENNYFEGWYFKNTTDTNRIAFIPGIHISEKEKKAFIQIITQDTSHFINYEIDDFTFCHEPFYIKIANNYFSQSRIHVDIHDTKRNLIIYGDLRYSDAQKLHSHYFSPNIMGPFSYVPFMECNHAILSMKMTINGFLNVNHKRIDFRNGSGYIEKDWGCSFPKSYIWCQGNDFSKTNAAFILAAADIPFTLFHFKGIICVLTVNGKEFRFATYNNSKMIKCDISDTLLNIVLKKGSHYLHVKVQQTAGLKLTAPVNGKMETEISETISAVTTVTLIKKNKVLFADTSMNCGLEIVSGDKHCFFHK